MTTTESMEKSKYLLIPVPPTPNGRLHLGHMAGPYLRMDMLRRSLEQDGHEVELWTGTDSHDSFVLHRAYLSDLTPVEVCEKFHPLIEADMKALGIKVDGFVDTLTGEGRNLQEQHACEATDELLANGLATERTESILYDEVHKLPVVGTWLSGLCPQCGSPCIGYFCEGCFTHNQPSELLNRSSRMPGGSLVTRTVDSIFLEIPDALSHIELLEEMGVLPAAIDVVRWMLATPNRNFRISVPIDWGLTYEPDSQGQARSIFEVLWELYTYSEMQAKRSPHLIPAWKAESDIKAIVACGVDNTIALLMGCVGVYSQLPGAKPPEHIHINYFVKLEGAKFSTNRNHAIWASDLASLCDGKVDGVRLYLARISPEYESTNFDIDEFVAFYNNTYIKELLGKVNLALSKLVDKAETSAKMSADITNLREKLADVLSPKQVSISKAASIFEEWATADKRYSSAISSEYWWLKGVALLGYPFAPELCSQIWEFLGHSGIPSFNELLDIHQVQATGPLFIAAPNPIQANQVRNLIGRPLIRKTESPKPEFNSDLSIELQA